jgi:hypothetical protein
MAMKSPFGSHKYLCLQVGLLSAEQFLGPGVVAVSRAIQPRFQEVALDLVGRSLEDG